MKYLQYQGPADTFDASNIVGKPMVFHAPNSTTVGVPPDQRGNLIQVTNEHAAEFLTYPNHRFVEVPDDVAKPQIEKQKKAQADREAFEANITRPEVAPAVAPVLTVFPATPEVLPSSPRAVPIGKSRASAPVTGGASATTTAAPATGGASAPATGGSATSGEGN